MSVFIQKYNCLADEIVTEAAVVEPIEISDKVTPRFVTTDNAMWDTGAENTIVSQRIIDALKLQPVGKCSVIGIGGDQEAKCYKIHLGLPNKRLYRNLIVMGSDLEDYDILIGMDVITKTDFLISSKDTTVFSFRYPSEGNAEIK